MHAIGAATGAQQPTTGYIPRPPVTARSCSVSSGACLAPPARPVHAVLWTGSILYGFCAGSQGNWESSSVRCLSHLGNTVLKQHPWPLAVSLYPVFHGSPWPLWQQVWCSGPVWSQAVHGLLGSVLGAAVVVLSSIHRKKKCLWQGWSLRLIPCVKLSSRFGFELYFAQVLVLENTFNSRACLNALLSRSRCLWKNCKHP